LLRSRFLCVSRDEIGDFGSDWDRLAALQPQYVPGFTDLLTSLDDGRESFILAGERQGDEVTALVLFLVAIAERGFWLGDRPLMRLRLRTASLYGSTSLGALDDETAIGILRDVGKARGIDVVALRDVAESDPLCRVIADGRWPGPAYISRARGAHRLATLPQDMGEYWNSLRPTTRRAGLRDLRMFDRLDPTYEVVDDPAGVATFLSRAAGLSARTYQAKLGLGVDRTEATLAHFTRLASEGRFRGYLASVDGRDAAFCWGDISHGVFFFRATGFDPALARSSPGKAILLAAIRNLIETRAAHTFDFSGRDTDYKERFSTKTIPSAYALVTRWSRPRGLAAVGLEKLFASPRALVSLLGEDRSRVLRRRLGA